MDSLLADFRFERILREDVKTKLLVLLGKISDQYCIITAEKTAFCTEDLTLIFQPESLNIDLANDVYVSNLVDVRFF
jgi:hypothetical protein